MKNYCKSIFFLSFIILISTNITAQLIQHITIIDGTGKKGFKSAVRIEGNKIVSVGNLIPYKGEKVIDGKGMLLAPGFIDSHSHHFGALMQHPSGIPSASQGVTTIVIGQDGESFLMDSLRAMINRQPIAINVATYTGHSTLREMVMGEHDVLRKATAAEIDKMKLLLNDDLQKGSLGLSTGLEYEQAFYSSKEEVIDLAKIAAMNHTRYMSHIRSEDVTIDDAMDEIISIGRITKMPVQISHLKIGIKDKWNTADLILKKLEAARAEGINITADVYPYNYWNSTLRVLFAKRDYENLASAQFAVDQVFDADESYLVQFAPEPSYKGKTISVIAKERNESPAKTIIELIKLASAFKKVNPNYEGTVEAIAAKGMNEKDVANFIAWTHSNICSDGKDGGHPRGYGSFTKVLSKYTREDKLLFLEEAIHKMTGLTAAHLGIENRGTIQEGNIADLVLFDPNTVKDNSTIQDSKALSNGIQMVWVNGQLIYQKKKATGKLPGTLITSKN